MDIRILFMYSYGSKTTLFTLHGLDKILINVSDSGLWEMVPKGTRSLLVQPILHPSDNEIEKAEGFVLLASSMRYAYSDKDRAWTGALTNKFRGK